MPHYQSISFHFFWLFFSTFQCWCYLENIALKALLQNINCLTHLRCMHRLYKITWRYMFNIIALLLMSSLSSFFLRVILLPWTILSLNDRTFQLFILFNILMPLALSILWIFPFQFTLKALFNMQQTKFTITWTTGWYIPNDWTHNDFNFIYSQWDKGKLSFFFY